MNQRKSFYLALSLALHALVAAYFILSPGRTEEVSKLVSQVEFEVTPSTEQIKDTAKVGSGSRQGAKAVSASFASGSAASKDSIMGKKILLESSQMSFENAGTASMSGETVFGEGLASSHGSGAWVEQVDFKQGVELTTFFQRIMDKIDRTLDYPEDMARERMNGEVRLDFYVNRKGQIVGDFQSVKGAEPLLNLYVMSSLLVILKDPLPENLWSEKDERIAMSLSVRFEIYQFSEMQIRNSASFQSNELTLTRARYVVPLAVEKTTKFFTRYVPPIIPIPGGFYVDVVMLAQYIQNINTPDPDDKRQQRLAITRERLESAMKKKSVN